MESLLNQIAKLHTPGGGARIDLHCHSTFSTERIKWLPFVYHPMLTPIETYRLAKTRGMQFVTITDHDTIDGCLHLLEEHGPLDDFVIGEEVSVAFPEDQTVVHVNVFDINEAQHAELQRLGNNLYDLVDYLTRIDKLYVLNHLTWTAQHRVLKTWQIERLLELFPIFEGINGTRSFSHNAFAWRATDGHNKTLVGGSDSHSNRVGTTYTLSQGDSVPALIASIRAGNASACGAFGTPEKLAEDVWLVLHREIERRLAAANSRSERLKCRVVRQIGRMVYPLACLGYHKRQNRLIDRFLLALPR